MQKDKSILTKLILSSFMSYLTNYTTIFGGSTFEENLGLIASFIALLIYFILFKYLFRNYNNFITERLKKITSKVNIQKTSIKFVEVLIFPAIILLASLIILIGLSIKSYMAYLNWYIPKINIMGLLVSIMIFLIIHYLIYLNLLKRLTNQPKECFMYSLIFIFNFIFYMSLAFISVKLITEFITTLITIGGGVPFFGPA